MNDKTAAEKKMPRGGRKGGTQFPHIGLKKALEYSKKLVTKTHVSPLPAANILPGVFGQAGGKANVRASALKQYGLMEGSAEGYHASQLAKDIDGSPEEDKLPLLKQAALLPKVFRQLFDTFHGDTIHPSRIEQYARQLNVHPESAAECAKLFSESMITAGLGNSQGDSLVLVQAQAEPTQDQDAQAQVGSEDGQTTAPEQADFVAPLRTLELHPPMPPANRKTAVPVVNLAMNVDSSSDPDKLEKQLKLLRSYGLI